jgi:NDP-sugar pyrophosphorylase family protein
MHYAIIAAGRGSRLVQEGIEISKPLVMLNGITLIDRLINIFCENNAESVSIILNKEMMDVYYHLNAQKFPVPISIMIKSTISSLHSFFELSFFLRNKFFCLTTVDTIFNKSDFSNFIQEFEKNALFIDGMMAITTFIDDENPLYTSVNKKTFEISNFSSVSCSKYVSGGIYCLTPSTIKILDHCVKTGVSHMRNYQQKLVACGLKLKAYIFGKIIDIDHSNDIIKANFFLKTNERAHLSSIVGVKRGELYSPGSNNNDSVIFNLTSEYLKKKDAR